MAERREAPVRCHLGHRFAMPQPPATPLDFGQPLFAPPLAAHLSTGNNDYTVFYSLFKPGIRPGRRFAVSPRQTLLWLQPR